MTGYAPTEDFARRIMLFLNNTMVAVTAANTQGMIAKHQQELKRCHGYLDIKNWKGTCNVSSPVNPSTCEQEARTKYKIETCFMKDAYATPQLMEYTLILKFLWQTR